MSNKYIKQIDNDNFVFPNNTLAEYDVDIIHDLKEDSVQGVITGFSPLTFSGSPANIGISFTYQWSLNGAEPFISNDNKLNVLSLHMQSPDRKFYKPWTCVGLVQDNNVNLTYKTDTFLVWVTPQMMGQTSFSSGTYYFEIRFLGHRAVFPISVAEPLALPTPTPTPSPTPTGPTPTPGGATPTPTPTSTPSIPCACVEIIVTGATGGVEPVFASIEYNNCFSVLTGEMFATNGTRYRCIDNTGGVIQVFSSNGLTYNYASGFSCGAGTCPTSIVVTPTPTPTPTGLPATATPTPTPTATSAPATATPTPTATGVPPTDTPTPTPTSTPTSTPLPDPFLAYISDISAANACSGGNIGQYSFQGSGSNLCNSTTVSQTIIANEIVLNGDFWLSDGTNSRYYTRNGSPVNTQIGTAQAACVTCPTPTPTPTVTATPTVTPTHTPTPTATPIPFSMTAFTGTSANQACSRFVDPLYEPTILYYSGSLGICTILYRNNNYTNPVVPTVYCLVDSSTIYVVGTPSPQDGEITGIVACPTPTPVPTSTPVPSTYDVYERCDLTAIYYVDYSAGNLSFVTINSECCSRIVSNVDSAYIAANYPSAIYFSTFTNAICPCD
jgi:hypothetical protein